MMRPCAFRRAAYFLGLAAPIHAQTIRDSAGIVIVENPAPNPATMAFRVGAAPVMRFVGDTLTSPTPLMMTSLLRLPSGRFVVNDGNAGQLRYYSAAGQFQQAIDGRGPGQMLKAIYGLYRARGDSLIVYAYQSGSPLLFDERGQFVRRALSAPPEIPMGRAVSTSSPLVAQLRGVFADGSLAVDGLGLPYSPAPTWKPAGDAFDARLPSLYLHMNADGSRVLDTLGIFLGNDAPPSYVFRSDTTPSGVRRSTTTLVVPGLRKFSLQIDGDRVVVADGTTYEIRVYSTSGALVRIIRAALPPRPFSADVIARVTAEATGKLTGAPLASAIEGMRAVRWPRTFAAFGRVIVDDAHRIWVEAALADGQPQYWTVFDRDGRLMGTVTLPDTRRIAWIGEDMIAFTGVVNPRLGSEMVLYRFAR